MTALAQGIVAAVVCGAAGLALVVWARPIAVLHVDARREALRRTSVLNVERDVASFDNPRSLAIETWALRGAGVVLAAGGVLALLT